MHMEDKAAHTFPNMDHLHKLQVGGHSCKFDNMKIYNSTLAPHEVDKST